MIKRVFKNLSVFSGDVPDASAQLERDGCAVLREVLTVAEVEVLRSEIDDVFATTERATCRTSEAVHGIPTPALMCRGRRASSGTTERERSLVGLHAPMFYDG